MKPTIHRFKWVWVLRMLAGLGILAFGVAVFFGTSLVPNAEAQAAEPKLVESQSEALSSDAAILSEEAGLPVDQVERALVFQQAFSNYADELIERYPDQISSVWTEPVPATKGHIQFTNDVPSEAASGIERHGLDPNSVILTGGGMVTMADHTRRARLAGEALVDLGFFNHTAFFDRFENVIRVELQVPDESLAPSKVNILDKTQERVNSDQKLRGRASRVEPQDLELTIIKGSGPIFTPAHSRGGVWLRDHGTNTCTSGWAVSGPNGDGIITAGHCVGINEIDPPGENAYSTLWQSQVYGVGGDVEYHTTPNHAVPAEYYADATNIRPVNGIKTTNSMVGNSVCSYGHSSNTRTCNHTVEAVGQCIWSAGVFVCKLARASNNALTFGDSGGGWSFAYDAWGVFSGWGSGKSYFTPSQEAQWAVNVTIKTQ